MKFKLSYAYVVTMILWVILLIPSLTIWSDSILLLIFMSWYANFTTDLNNWMTAKVKERSERDAAEVKKEAVTEIVHEAGKHGQA